MMQKKINWMDFIAVIKHSAKSLGEKVSTAHFYKHIWLMQAENKKTELMEKYMVADFS